jgi:multiple sugar transport system permease protein
MARYCRWGTRPCWVLWIGFEVERLVLMSTLQTMSGTQTARATPTLLKLTADNWRLAMLTAIVVSALAAVALPASVSFWIVGAMAAIVAATLVVNAYRRRYYGGLLVAPAIAVLVVMNIFPLLWSLGLSFFAYQSSQQSIRFVGLNNYIKVLTDDIAAPANWNALVNTAMFVVLTVSAQMIVGFLLAILFSKQFPLRKYLLILVLTPMMLSVVASGVFFTYYYDPTFGILSYVLNSITGSQFILMDSKAGAVAGIVFADAWMWSPFVMLLVLAGLVSVPKYLYEAAAIDRVSGWRSFWSITFPYIRGLLMLALLFRTIEAFKLADLVILLTRGGNDTMTISYHLIRIANEQNKTSEGAAISYIMLFMVIVLTNLYLYLPTAETRRAEPWQTVSPFGNGSAFAGAAEFLRLAGAARSSSQSSASSTSCRFFLSSSLPSNRNTPLWRCRRHCRPHRSSA